MNEYAPTPVGSSGCNASTGTILSVVPNQRPVDRTGFHATGQLAKHLFVLVLQIAEVNQASVFSKRNAAMPARYGHRRGLNPDPSPCCGGSGSSTKRSANLTFFSMGQRVVLLWRFDESVTTDETEVDQAQKVHNGNCSNCGSEGDVEKLTDEHEDSE